MTEFNAPSGAEISVGVAPFQDAMALKDAVMSTLGEAGIDLETLLDKKGKSKKSILEDDVEETLLKLSGPILKAFTKLDSSKDLRKCLFKCLERCKYNGEKITLATFEPEEARGDYYSIVTACIKANLYPFFQNLNSKLETLQKKLSVVRK